MSRVIYSIYINIPKEKLDIHDKHILKDNQTVWQKSFPAKVVGTGKTIEEITLEMPNETGDYQMTASIQNQAGETISSKRKFHIK